MELSRGSNLAKPSSYLAGDFETYVSGQSDIIIAYATARRREEPISMSRSCRFGKGWVSIGYPVKSRSILMRQCLDRWGASLDEAIRLAHT
ncbi:MAG: hypothetical protein QOH05_113 [Acetobacteraceae bacterium]|jgi:hypothetical protein|nr:hypothetical protein [Acetobacteraceae bacterium]